jgi:hypothetical protein
MKSGATNITLIVVIGLLGGTGLLAQAQPLRAPRSISEYVDQLRRGGGCSPTASPSQMQGIAGQVEGLSRAVQAASARELKTDLPVYTQWLMAGSEQDRRCAGIVLLAVVFRMDSTTLLRPHIPKLGTLLNSQDDQMQRTVGTILSSLRPAPPPEVIPPFLTYLQSSGRNQQMQAAAVSTLLRADPQNTNVIAAVAEFSSRTLSIPARETLLNGIANSKTNDPRLIRLVIDGLQTRDQPIRYTAVQAIRRMGPNAVRQAQPELQQLAHEGLAGDDDTQKRQAQIREFAKEALRMIAH